LLCKETNEWYENLLKVTLDQVFVAQVHDNLHKYVTENYSGKQNLEVLKTISNECLSPGISMIDNRFRVYLDLVERDATWNPAMTPDNSMLLAILRRNRSWLLPTNSLQDRLARFILRIYRSLTTKEIHQSEIWNPLSARSSVRLLRKLNYTLRPQAPWWTGFEFMIGTHNQKAEGQLNIEIVDKATGTTIRLQSIELNDIKDNQIIKVNFAEMHDSRDKDFTVQFSLQTPGSKTLISIYEENDKESIGRNILRRSGLLTRGNTLACRFLYVNH
jgi:hypothetical protein